MLRKFETRLVVVCLSAFVAGGCAPNTVANRFAVEGRVWPESPDVPRIVYMGEFASASDLSISQSIWETLVSFTVGAKDSAMVRPMDVATTADAEIIFVADPDAGCVHRYDIDASRYRCLAPGPGERRASPVGVTVTEDGSLFASDPQQGQIWQAGSRDKKLEPFLVSEALDQPTGVYWNDDTQLLFVTDTGRQSVLVFDRQGNLKKSIGVRGSLPGQFNYPTYLWVDSNNELIVADSLNFRIQRFDSDANFLYEFGKNGNRPGDFSRPKGVAMDSFGHIYVVDALMHLIQVFSQAGELLISVGEQGQAGGEFWLPNGIFITKDNTIFVADSYNKRIQIFRYVGSE